MYSREELISLCERAIVPQEHWGNRDSGIAHLNIGQAWALLKANCEFEITEVTSSTILIEIVYEGFNAFEYGADDPDNMCIENFYIPTQARLEAHKGSDWY